MSESLTRSFSSKEETRNATFAYDTLKRCADHLHTTEPDVKFVRAVIDEFFRLAIRD